MLCKYAKVQCKAVYPAMTFCVISSIRVRPQTHNRM